MTAKTHNRIARWLSLAALVMFALFHFLPVFVSGEPVERGGLPKIDGTQIWIDLWTWAHDPSGVVNDPVVEVFVPTFMLATIGFVVTPFCMGTLSRSRVLWWAWMLVWAISGIAHVWDWVVIFRDESSRANGAFGIGPGLMCLTVALQLELVALFFVRSSKPEESASFPTPA